MSRGKTFKTNPFSDVEEHNKDYNPTYSDEESYNPFNTPNGATGNLNFNKAPNQETIENSVEILYHPNGKLSKLRITSSTTWDIGLPR